MKFKTKPSKNQTRDTVNAWNIATNGGELSRVSVSKYRKAYELAERLRWLNNFADWLADFDNSQRYTEEKSEKYNKRLQQMGESAGELLPSLGLEWFVYSHLYHIKSKKTGREIYIKL